MGGNLRAQATGQPKRPVVTSGRRRKSNAKRARCEYCRGWVADGEHREITVGGETKYVHDRHPRREAEEQS